METMNSSYLPETSLPSRKFIRKAYSDLSESDQMLFELFGQGPLVSPPYSLVHEAFEAQVARQPHAVAAYHLGDSVTYQTLDRQANRLAAYLAQIGVKPGDNVSLFIQRSIPMLVGILATLKAGAAYVPQDARIAPEEQMRYVNHS